MKNNLPRLWAVKNDGSELFRKEVIEFFGSTCNNLYGYYYGIIDDVRFCNQTCDDIRYGLTEKLTLDKFIELKNNSKIPKDWYIVLTDFNRNILREYFSEYAIFANGAKFGMIDERQIYHRAGCEYKDYNQWTEITTEDFIKYFLNKRIKGYKLKNVEYLHEAKSIAAGNVASFISKESIVEPGSHHFKNLEKAGVLDLWFEKIYEVDYTILTLGSKNITIKVYKDKFEADGDEFTILELKMLKKNFQDFQNSNMLVSPLSKHDRPIKIVSFTVSCTTFQMEDIDKILEAAEKLK